MLIVRPISDAQTVEVFSRVHNDPGENYDVLIHDESTNVNTMIKAAGTYNEVSINLAIAHAFVEGRYYVVKVYHPTTGEVLNFSKLLCTDQTDFEKFTVLDGYYTQIEKPEQTYIVKK